PRGTPRSIKRTRPTQGRSLAPRTGHPTTTTSHAPPPPPPQRLSHSEFTRQVAHLQTLRNAL
ncbi:hypothetical protein GIV49_06415, partial [Pseudomonas syringae]|nr:hypothetical protein [Pseudomonas syringae]